MITYNVFVSFSVIKLRFSYGTKSFSVILHWPSFIIFNLFQVNASAYYLLKLSEFTKLFHLLWFWRVLKVEIVFKEDNKFYGSVETNARSDITSYHFYLFSLHRFCTGNCETVAWTIQVMHLSLQLRFPAGKHH